MSPSVSIGLTGGIGAGKSTVARIFRAFGVPYYDADRASKHLMQTNTVLKNALTEQFGADCYQKDGTLHTTAIAQKVFHSPDALQRLNVLVHPVVAADYVQWQAKQLAPYYLCEAAILLGSVMQQHMHKICVVVAPKALRIARIQQRDARSLSEINAIMHRQMPPEKMEELADMVLHNDEKQSLLTQVQALHSTWLNEGG
ncbi:MAG: dephospho-CoA kinase [Gammaproteobacteria bacterium]|nr:dephospho-CoA kinase [Gammaproteobacteria bacterium]